MLDLSGLSARLTRGMVFVAPSIGTVTAWMFAGAMLLVLGWASLPRTPRTEGSGAGAGRGGFFARIAGGATLAGVASALAYVALSYLPDPIPHLELGGSVAGGAAVSLLLPACVVGGIAGELSGSTRWSPSGLSAWMGLALLSSGFVGYAGLIVSAAQGAFAITIGASLTLLEGFGLVLMLAYQFYALEQIAGVGTTRRAVPVDDTGTPRLPRVAVQVASYNEPAEVVEACLASVLALDYPADLRVVQLLDDSTDSETARVLERYCRGHGVDYRHRPHRKGFKAGALNEGLAGLPGDVELLAIIDSDYVVEPDYLRVVVRAFDDPSVGFVQTPQAYRNVRGSSFGRWYALADAYFYHVVQPVRARHGSAIFCGTMGVVRRRALEAVGGWSEECVTEDAELSVRLIASGWNLAYFDRPFGHGLAPLDMAGVRSQHRRWAYGGIQMLRMNWERLSSPTVSRRQRWDFRIGGMFWADGVFFLGMAATLSLVAVGSWFGQALPSPSAWALALAASAPLLLLWDGILKVRVALRPSHRASYRDVVGILAFWYAVKINDLRAALRGLLGGRLEFVRTPKNPVRHASRGQAVGGTLRSTSIELGLLAAIGLVDGLTAYRGLLEHSTPLTVPGAFLLAWLAYYALALATAPVLDWVSRRAPSASPVERTRPGRPRQVPADSFRSDASGNPPGSPDRAGFVS